jgi:hypothetical protein
MRETREQWKGREKQFANKTLALDGKQFEKNSVLFFVKRGDVKSLLENCFKGEGGMGRICEIFPCKNHNHPVKNLNR